MTCTYREYQVSIDLQILNNTQIEYSKLRTRLVLSIFEDDIITGFGERFDSMNQYGKHLYCWCEDGGWDLTSVYFNYPLNLRLPKLNDVSTYFPMPYFYQISPVMKQTFGLWVNTTYETHFDIGKQDRQSLIIEEELTQFKNIIDEKNKNLTSRYILFMNPTPANILAAFIKASQNINTNIAGIDIDSPTSVLVPPMWSFGPWNEFNNEFNDTSDSYTAMIRYLAEDIPVSVWLNNLHFMPKGDQNGEQQQVAKLVQKVKNIGIQSLAYYNSMIDINYTSRYQYALNHSYFVMNPFEFNSTNDDDTPYVFEYKGAGPNPFRVSTMDYTNNEANKWYQSQLKQSVDLGFVGFMYDYGEYIDPQSYFKGNQMYGKSMHNLYPVLYQSSAHTMFKNLNISQYNGINAPDYLFYARSGYVGSQTQIWSHWTGDPSCDFGKVSGLPAHLKAMLNIGTSGVPFSGSNIPGFVWYKPPSLELWVRWIAVGAFSGSMQDDTGGTPLGDPITHKEYPKSHINDWPFGTQFYRKYTKLRIQLIPYIYTMAYKSHYQYNLPLMRYLFMDDSIYQTLDYEAFSQEYSYMFGDSLYVSPVIDENANEWKVYLPKFINNNNKLGSWLLLDSNEPYMWIYNETDARFRLKNNSNILQGGTYITVNTPINAMKMPLFVKVGSIIPTFDCSIMTLNNVTNNTEPLKNINNKTIVSYYDRISILHFWAWLDWDWDWNLHKDVDNYNHILAQGSLWDNSTFEMTFFNNSYHFIMFNVTQMQYLTDNVVQYICQITQLPSVVKNVYSDIQSDESDLHPIEEVQSWYQVVDVANIDQSCWYWDSNNTVLYVKWLNLNQSNKPGQNVVIVYEI